MYLKARLTEAVIYFPKTHNLVDLLDLAIPTELDWEILRDDVDTLTNHAVITRYPGYYVTRKEVDEAVRICTKVRAVIRPALGLGG